jgi:hypothetical protein
VLSQNVGFKVVANGMGLVSKGYYIPIRYSRKYQVLVDSQAMDLLGSVHLPLQKDRSSTGRPGCQVELAGCPGHGTQLPSTDSCAWQSARPAIERMINLPVLQ